MDVLVVVYLEGPTHKIDYILSIYIEDSHLFTDA